MRQIAVVIGVLVLFPVIGTCGFRLCEGWPWLDCAYYAVIVMTTVGLATRPDLVLADATKLFVIFYLMAGIGVFSYCVGVLGQLILSLQFRGLMERRRMDREIDRLRDHYIVCGYGRMGQTIAQHLHSRKRPFVIVDNSAERMQSVSRERGWLHIVGDATDDEVLCRAGIVFAKSLAAVLPTDADNVYVVLSARLLNAKLQIIARAGDEKAVEKMERAGANRVVSPYSSGATKMARFMLNPSVEDFLEVTDQHGSQLELADIQVSENSPLAGKRLMDTALGERGVMIIGIRRADGERLMPPPASAVIHAGDSLFAFGSAEAVNAMIAESV